MHARKRSGIPQLGQWVLQTCHQIWDKVQWWGLFESNPYCVWDDLAHVHYVVRERQLLMGPACACSSCACTWLGSSSTFSHKFGTWSHGLRSRIVTCVSCYSHFVWISLNRLRMHSLKMLLPFYSLSYYKNVFVIKRKIRLSKLNFKYSKRGKEVLSGIKSMQSLEI